MSETTTFDTLCFIGGGAKGYVNPGSYKAFYESGLLNNISTFTGASVGALTSCLISVGIDPDSLHKKLSAQPVNELLGKGSWWSFGKLQKNGSGLRDLLGNVIKEEVKGFLDTKQDISKLTVDEQQVISDLKSKIDNNKPLDLQMSNLALLRKLNPAKFKNLLVVAVDKDTESLQQFSSVDQTELIKDWLVAINKSQTIINQTAFTKDDLETLSKVFEMGIEWKGNNGKALAHSPVQISDLQDKKIIQNCIKNIKNLLKNKQIKALAERASKGDFQLDKSALDTIKRFDPCRDYSIITGADGKANIFSNVSVIDATLASAALPLVLNNVKINGRRFADGGQLNNMPHNIIKTDGKSLVVAFSDDNMDRALHKPAEKIFIKSGFRKAIEALLRFLGVCIKKNNEQIKNKEFEEIRNKKPLTTIANNTGGVETTNFKEANKQKDEGFLRGYFSTMNHLILYNYHPKAQEIIGLEENLKNHYSQDLEANLKQQAKSFQQLRENFEIRKFVFDAVDKDKIDKDKIDKDKGIDRKSDWYKSIIKFCLEESNFQGEPKTVFETAIGKFIHHEEILKAGLDNLKISSEIISLRFEEYCKSSNRNEKIVQGVNQTGENSKWRQNVLNQKENYNKTISQLTK